MSKIRYILRFHHQGKSKLLIASQNSIARNTLKKHLRAFTSSGFIFDKLDALGDKDSMTYS